MTFPASFVVDVTDVPSPGVRGHLFGPEIVSFGGTLSWLRGSGRITPTAVLANELRAAVGRQVGRRHIASRAA